MPVWETIHNIPALLPLLAILAGAVVATSFSLVRILNRARLVERIKHTELELKRARDGARAEDGRVEKPRDTVLVEIHDRLVKYRQDLRRTDQHANISRLILPPLLAGSFIGTGYVLGSIQDRDQLEQMRARFQELEHELDDWRAKGRRLEEKFLMQARSNAEMAKKADEYAHENEALHDRLVKTAQRLADEKKERIELEVLLGRAEQRRAGLEDARDREHFEAGSFPSVEDAPSPPENTTDTGPAPDMSGGRPFEESDFYADDRMRPAADATSLYTGRLKGQIAFAGRRRRLAASWGEHHIYVLVRWGVSSWIVTYGRARVNPDGAVEGEFRVVLPIRTIRTLDVTAIASNTVYRRYQHVRFPDYQWKASTATIPVHRS